MSTSNSRSPKNTQKMALELELEFYTNLLAKYKQEKQGNTSIGIKKPSTTCPQNMKNINPSGLQVFSGKPTTFLQKSTHMDFNQSKIHFELKSRNSQLPDAPNVHKNLNLVKKSVYIPRVFDKSRMCVNNVCSPKTKFSSSVSSSRSVIISNNINLNNQPINAHAVKNVCSSSRTVLLSNPAPILNKSSSQTLMNDIQKLTQQLRQKSKNLEVKSSTRIVLPATKRNLFLEMPLAKKTKNVTLCNSVTKTTQNVKPIVQLDTMQKELLSMNIHKKSVLNNSNMLQAPMNLPVNTQSFKLAKKYSLSSKGLASKSGEDPKLTESTVKKPVLNMPTKESFGCVKRFRTCRKLVKSKYKVVNNATTFKKRNQNPNLIPRPKVQWNTRKLSPSKYKVTNKGLSLSVRIVPKKLAFYQKISVNDANSAMPFNSERPNTGSQSPVSKYCLNRVYGSPIHRRKVISLAESKKFVKASSVVRMTSTPLKQLDRNILQKKIFLKSHRKNILNHSLSLSKSNSKHLVARKKPADSFSKKHRRTANSKTKYRVVNKESPSSEGKMAKGLRIPASKVCDLQNKGMDLDLLMELAEEKNSSDTNKIDSFVKPKSVLLRRLYKSKNRLVNKNVCSTQTKVANMIKTKYCALNKHKWRKFSPKQQRKAVFKGQYELRPRMKYPSFSFQNQGFKKKSSKYTNYRYPRKFKVSTSPYSKKVFMANKKTNAYATSLSRNFSTSKRIFISRQNFKACDIKSLTFRSRTLASRAVNRSINRINVKKDSSKANTYCMFYNRFGRCNKGLTCPYIHDPSKIAICTRFLRGTCKVEKCPFSHEICPGKMAICSFFLLGCCTNSGCPYRHETLPPDAKLCKAFVQGYCPRGKECEQAHVLVCPQFVQGLCEKGDACAFPHPPPRKKTVQNSSVPEKCEVPENAEELLDKVSRYFEISKKESVENLVVPKRQKILEQPSFISLNFDKETENL